MVPLRKVEVKRLYAAAAAEYPPRAELVFVLQSLEDPLNVGSLFRIADACGVREMVFTGRTPTPPHEAIDRTSRGHDRRVPWRQVPQAEEALESLRQGGYHLVALETARGARCFLDYPYPRHLALVLGNESRGVYPSTLARCDGAVYIPMYGKGPSLNVHVAAALVAYQALLGRGPGAERAAG
ncbi:MAG: TrmH family RNA methyltransferase [Candidatus Latescibacterota bacterium]